MKDLSLHILDIAHNSVRAKATNVVIGIEYNHTKDELMIMVEDNGCGMTPEQVSNVTDPFFTSRTTRKVGLGIPLLKQRCEECNGSFFITSTVGKGTKLEACFQLSHIDLPEIGDFSGVFSMLCCSVLDVEWKLYWKNDDNTFSISTQEMKAELGEDIPLNTPGIEDWLREMIVENTVNTQES